MSSKVPEGLSDVEYARHILEEVLGFPCKGNIDLMADCLRSVGKSKCLVPVKAHAYMVRAIKLAKEQGQEITRMWFMDGDYTHVRPNGKTVPKWHGPTKEEEAAFEAHKKTPEYKEAVEKLHATFQKLKTDPKFETKRSGA